MKIRPAYPLAFDSGPALAVSIAETPQGRVFKVGNAATFAHLDVSNEIPAFNAMNTATASFLNSTQHAVDTYSEKHRPTKIKEAVTKNLSASFRAAQKAAIAYLENHTANVAKFSALPEVVDSDLENAYRADFKVMNHAERAKALRDWPVTAIAAVLRLDPSVLKLDVALIEAAMNRIKIHNLTQAPAVKSSFTLIPNAANPIARGVDSDAAMQYANEAIKQWQHRDDVIELARTQLRDLISVVSVATDQKPESAYELLIGA